MEPLVHSHGHSHRHHQHSHKPIKYSSKGPGIKESRRHTKAEREAEERKAKIQERMLKYAEKQFEEREKAIEGHPERYYSEYELAKPAIRSFEEPETGVYAE